jgi:plastocyanin
MVTLVVVLWYSAALWYFNNFDSPGLSPSVSAARAAYPGNPTSAGGAAGTSAAPVGGVVPVTYKGISIAPANVTVKAGGTIKWTNFDATLHNVAITSGPVKFSSPGLQQGRQLQGDVRKAGGLPLPLHVSPREHDRHDHRRTLTGGPLGATGDREGRRCSVERLAAQAPGARAFPLSDVKAYMAHADIQTTMIYVHHVPQHDAADKLSRTVRSAIEYGDMRLEASD